MRKIRIPHPDFRYTEKTYLDADYATASTALTVLNNYGFANDDIAIVGEPGEEKSECKDVTGQTGNTQIDISATLKFNHNKNTVVYRYEYDQYEIYRYRAAAWTLISTSYIQWDKDETIYVDKNGLSTDSYRYRLCNSVSAAVSDYSPTVAATGFTRAQVGYMVREVRTIAGDLERKYIKTDDEIIRQFNRAQEIIYSIRNDWWFLRAEDSSITTTADTKKYSLAGLTRFSNIDTVRYRYNDGTTDVTYHLTFKPLVEHDYDVRDNSTTNNSDDRPSSYTILPADSTSSNGYIELNINSKTAAYGTFYIRYYQTMAELDDVADSTSVPIPSILEDFALAYVFDVKSDKERADIYRARFYGPMPGRDEDYQEPTGIRLLERIQNAKSRAIGQPASLKRFRGRTAMSRLFNSDEVDRDYRVEKYW